MRDWTQKIDNTAPALSGLLAADEDNARAYEGRNLVSTAGISLDAIGGPDTNLYMMAEAVGRYASGAQFGTDSGAANAYVVSSILAFKVPRALFKGMRLYYEPAGANTGASTCNAFGLGAKQIFTHTGSALVGGEILSGRLIELYYDPALASSVGGWKLAPWANALLFSGGGGGGGGVTVADLPKSLHAYGYTAGSPNTTDVYLSAFNNIDKNTFTTSTYSGGAFTVGSGEGGLYLVNVNLSNNNGSVTNGEPHAVFLWLTVNSTDDPGHVAVASTFEFSTSNDVPTCQICAGVLLQAGDVLRIGTYWSKIGFGTGAINGYWSNDIYTNLTIARVTK